jgi:hypothetical protein
VTEEVSTLIFDSGMEIEVAEARKEIDDQLRRVPSDCTWFEYETLEGEKISVSRERIIAVREGDTE